MCVWLDSRGETFFTPLNIFTPLTAVGAGARGEKLKTDPKWNSLFPPLLATEWGLGGLTHTDHLSGLRKRFYDLKTLTNSKVLNV